MQAGSRLFEVTELAERLSSIEAVMALTEQVHLLTAEVHRAITTDRPEDRVSTDSRDAPMGVDRPAR